jgi:D-alanyl-lipoteichoic acid acyltransferase DltB (MBOAT superfamily)
VRKVVIADALSKAFPTHLWDQPRDYSPPQLILYLVIYAVALYNDFAGYTSIARGVSGLFGIELASNFNVPYFARSGTEFWNRWHITLSQWLRDYIYYPTSRVLLRRNPHYTNIPNLIVPPLLTMLISGLWHGTGWGMLLWGGLHGVYLVVERLLSLWKPAGPPRLQPRWRQGMAMLIVFVLVLLAWVPFRVGDLSTTFDYWRGMTEWSGTLRWPSLLVVLALIPPIWLDWVQYRRDDDLVFLRWPRLVQAALLAVAILAIFLSSQSRTTVPFVYQGF